MTSLTRARHTSGVARCVAVLLFLALVVSACGEDPVRRARIDEPRRPGSTTGQVGSVRLLVVRIQAPAADADPENSNAGLFLTIANGGPTEDALIAVSSIDARRVVQRDGAEDALDDLDLSIASRGTASLQDPEGMHLELEGLKRDIRSGQFVPVTFRFREAGVVTLKVFVQIVDRAVVLPSADPEPEN